MARPREFDEEEVLGQITEVFWSRGYEATGIQDLVEATGVNRASLYGAFGDKQQIFERVLRRYTEAQESAIRAACDNPSPTRALESLFQGWMKSSCPKNGPKGCMLLVAGMDTSREAEWIQTLFLDQMARNEEAFAKLIARGQATGELDDAEEPDVVARRLVIILQGLASAARGGWKRERVRSVLEELLASLTKRRQA